MENLVLITGNDEFAVKNKARKLISEIAGEDFESNPELEIIQGDRDDLKPDEILSELIGTIQTPPFLTTQKIVWFKHFAHFNLASGSDKSKHKPVFDKLTKLIKGDFPGDVLLVIDGPELDRRTSFYKVLQKKGEVHYFEKSDLSSKDFSKSQGEKIRLLCHANGKKISNDAVGYLVDTLGSDSGRLNNELEKLFCYTGEEENIGLSDCRDVCSRTPEALSWSFANALTEKSVESALETVNILMAQMLTAKGGSSKPELAMLYAAIRNFQELIKVKKDAEELDVPRRCGPDFFKHVAAGSKEKFPNNSLLSCHPFRAFKLVSGAARFSDEDLAAAVRNLLKANKQLVSSGGDPRIILEQLITNICC